MDNRIKAGIAAVAATVTFFVVVSSTDDPSTEPTSDTVQSCVAESTTTSYDPPAALGMTQTVTVDVLPVVRATISDDGTITFIINTGEAPKATDFFVVGDERASQEVIDKIINNDWTGEEWCDTLFVHTVKS